MRLSRDLLMRGITYKLQERPLGGLSNSIIRKLERLNLDSEASDAQKPAPPISLKAGTRLVREWRGVTHTVLVHHADGFEWNGRRYRSLTIVAREISKRREGAGGEDGSCVHYRTFTITQCLVAFQRCLAKLAAFLPPFRGPS